MNVPAHGAELVPPSAFENNHCVHEAPIGSPVCGVATHTVCLGSHLSVSPQSESFWQVGMHPVEPVLPCASYSAEQATSCRPWHFFGSNLPSNRSSPACGPCVQFCTHKPLGGSKAAILGLAFKPEVSDTRRSPAIALAGYLIDKNVQVSAYDPFAKSVVVRNGLLRSESDEEAAVRDADIVFLVTSHSRFRHIELRRLANVAKPGATVFDTRGFWSRAECEAAGFRYLGLGRP